MIYNTWYRITVHFTLTVSFRTHCKLNHHIYMMGVSHPYQKHVSAYDSGDVKKILIQLV